MEKINVAELLKDCSPGMELDNPIFENLEFDSIDKDNGAYPIICRVKTKWGYYNTHTFTEYGCYGTEKYSKCVIFPKGKTTWDGFQRPFKDGDVVFYDNCVSIFKEWGDETLFRNYVKVDIDGKHPMLCAGTSSFGKGIKREARFATEEEKAKLFQAIKDNGYRWNAETKTLEKLPKFKVGDRIRRKGETSTYTITYVNNAHYFYKNYVICDTCDDNWELVPDKFDITILKPFESKVLVRDTNSDNWIGAFYSHYKSKKFYTIGKSYYYQCIPYEGNENLLGKTEDCDEYYKNW